jgi:hypothetical protein
LPNWSIKVTNLASSGNALIHGPESMQLYSLAETQLLPWHLLISGYQVKNGLDSDQTVTKHFLKFLEHTSKWHLIVQITFIE